MREFVSPPANLRSAVSHRAYLADGTEVERAKEAVAALNPHRADRYWDWLQIGMGLKATDEDLLPVWDDWSQQSTKYVEGECARKWEKFSQRWNGPGTLFHMAKEDGWKPRRRVIGDDGASESNPYDFLDWRHRLEQTVARRGGADQTVELHGQDCRRRRFATMEPRNSTSTRSRHASKPNTAVLCDVPLFAAWHGSRRSWGPRPSSSRDRRSRIVSGTPYRSTADQTFRVGSVYKHTGWRELDGTWAYLHGGGAIGPDGPVPGVEVDLPPALANFSLVSPSDAQSRKDAVQASLRLLSLTPDWMAIPLLAGVYRSAIAPADFSVFISGLTGTGKSEEAALHQQHFGAAMNARQLPASWSSTANAIEAIAFAAKDALLTVDDFAPSGGQNDINRYHKEAERLFRGQGNSAGRLRMRADSSLRPEKAARGMILATGEDIPRVHSIRARILVLEMTQKTLNWEYLRSCQRDAAEGLYCPGDGKFRPVDGAAVRRDSGTAKSAGRRTAGSGPARKPPPYADTRCRLGLRVGGISGVRCGGRRPSTLRKRRLCGSVVGWHWARRRRLRRNTRRAADPVERFFQLISSAISSGAAHLAAMDGREPDQPEAWGWRKPTVATLTAGSHKANASGGWTVKTSISTQRRPTGWRRQMAGDDRIPYAAAHAFQADEGERLLANLGRAATTCVANLKAKAPSRHSFRANLL